MGILQTGAVVVPLDAQLTAGEVGEILSTSGAQLCIASARQAAVLAEVRAEPAAGAAAGRSRRGRRSAVVA